ncbi:leucine-rich repeat-containing protein 53 [Meriones unguiculatus]|uniref:leucine-rich repeat-containing protein 53 n=1 Tax=Meriones unguiculatus TaxID=10047 RepID=UPI000B4F0D8B|nr:leucine-rich repeat-containing protein 53 [Meriones unguiculatus]
MLPVTIACPASCVVCTQDVTLCHQLTYIVAAPESTRVLILTDGHLSVVHSTNLTLLVNLALLSLSRNAISRIQEGSLHGLTKLRTLSLGHNRIPSASLPDHTFSKLRSLQVLVLSHNALRSLRAAWFRNTRALSRLLLDGNQISNLTRSSFEGANLHRLRHLDLSNNFISFIEKDAFRPLPQLQAVDLSRNMLAHMPDAFTPLKQLSLLSLEGNRWSCVCDLYPLARFLRDFVRSPAHTLRPTEGLNCRVSPPAVDAAKSMLRLSETNCDSKGHNHTLAPKDRRPLLPGQDAALITVLVFAGAIGLTCVGLVIFNRKLQQGRANEPTSKTLCCRTLNGSLCAREARNGHAVGCCNCHLTRENETEVMADVGSRKETALSQESSHRATPASQPTAVDASLRELKGRNHGAGRVRACLCEGLPQAECTRPPRNEKDLCDTGLVTRCCSKTAEELSSLNHAEVQPQILPQHRTRKIDSSGDIFRSRYVTSASTLERKNLGKHSAHRSWQPPIGNGDGTAQPPSQSAFITRAPSKLGEPGECAAGKVFRRREGYGAQHGPLKQGKPTDPHSSTSFTCKYVSWDEFQDFRKKNKPDSRKHTRFEKEQIQINRAIEKFLRSQGSKEKLRLPERIKKAYSTKRVKFRDPGVVRANRLVLSAEAPVSWTQLDSESQHATSSDLNNRASLEEVKEAKERLPEHLPLKKKRSKPSPLSEKVKGHNLRIKLDLNPLGKAKVHPEESPKKLPKRHKQTRLHPKKPARTSERTFRAKPLSSVSFQLPERSSHAKLTSSKVPLEGAPEQTPHQDGTLRVDSLSVGSKGSTQGSCCPVGQAPNGSTSILPQPTVTAAEHQPSHPLFLPEQMVNATHLQVLGPSAACLGNVGKRVLPPQHSRGVIDHLVIMSAQYVDQDKLKINELNHFALSLGNQVIDTFSKGHRLDENQVLKQEEQNSSHEQLGSEEKTLTNELKLSHETAENCITDGDGINTENKIPQLEDRDSSPTASTQLHNHLPILVGHCMPHQQENNGRETHSKRASPRDKHGEPPGAQSGMKEQGQALAGTENPSAGSWMTQMRSTDGSPRTLDGGGEEDLVLCRPSSDKGVVSIKDLSDTDPQPHNHRPH